MVYRLVAFAFVLDSKIARPPIHGDGFRIVHESSVDEIALGVGDYSQSSLTKRHQSPLIATLSDSASTGFRFVVSLNVA